MKLPSTLDRIEFQHIFNKILKFIVFLGKIPLHITSQISVVLKVRVCHGSLMGKELIGTARPKKILCGQN
jgi:hypothetical protein